MRRAIEFPKLAKGFKFGSMNVHCETWTAYDSLLEKDGWVERRTKSHAWKTLGPWPGDYIAAHPPREPREAVAA